ncbi:MAG: LysE family translocator [Porticoccaceae bacterium]|jgi:threonine/homoserine/homoserine lactone efflux protein|nr:LysE family translocator [Porticoccaceae bacterium]MBT5003327.1 LysE family translocator [Porticoccaceae bacterium]MBT5102954.1 LysE family translocator [Porticoccaceae bacterium]MBT6422455.1 LysE family translocator [Porticoccaceae bacterium]MBT6692694.1 LysE family translocator [Porticoccaceae bacterium]
MELYLAILLFTATASITPGPNNIMIMAAGVNFGVQKSLPHLFGICLGFPIMVIAIGLGFSVVFNAYPLLHNAINVIGIIYLLYLAWLIASAKPTKIRTDATKPLSFIQAVLFQWVNPKAWVMATGAISAYTSSDGDILGHVLFIAFAFSITAGISVGIWLVFGAGLKRYLDNPLHYRVFNIVMAMLLVGSMSPVIINLIEQYLV